MKKHEKRLQKARNNPNAVSYNDFVSILENAGYTLRMTKGSHRVAYRKLEESDFIITFAEPHGKKKSVHENAVKKLLKQLEEMAKLEESGEDE
jgi:predicted RNA binding protein YcfA (HicA-like mRNA interferase family)